MIYLKSDSNACSVLCRLQGKLLLWEAGQSIGAMVGYKCDQIGHLFLNVYQSC